MCSIDMIVSDIRFIKLVILGRKEILGSLLRER